MKNQLNKEYAEKEFKMYFQNKRPEMLRYIPESALKILDVGCSDGSFSQQLKTERGIEIWGVEPNEKASDIASKRLDYVICAAFSSDLDLPKKSFDCVIFNDVLEHFVDPFTALDDCKEILKPKGIIVASIPNVRYFENIWNLLVHKSWEYVEEGILDKTHLRFFTCESIISTFENSGYKVDLIEGINPLPEFHTHYKKFKYLNFLFRGKIEDMRYLQFALVASLM